MNIILRILDILGLCKCSLQSVGVNVSNRSGALNSRDGPNVRLSAEAEGLGRLTERVPNVRPKFGRILYARMKQRLVLVSALSGQEMSW